MAGLSPHHPLAFTFGILGNIISCMVCLAPIATFRRVYKRKSTEGFQSVPYVVALFSAMLWIYYALLKGYKETLPLITINGAGCIIEGAYVIMYLIYAPKTAMIYTVKIVFILNISTFGLIVLLSLLLSKGHARVTVLGAICTGFSVCVFVAPLSIIRLVVRTRSIEFMPISLSVTLTLSAIVWFGYGYVIGDKFVAIPNIIGFALGVIQMVLYAYYKRYARQKLAAVEQQCVVPEHAIAIPRPCAEVHPIDRVDRINEVEPTDVQVEGEIMEEDDAADLATDPT